MAQVRSRNRSRDRDKALVSSSNSSDNITAREDPNENTNRMQIMASPRHTASSPKSKTNSMMLDESKDTHSVDQDEE
jgi:hypothetical protein